MPARCRVMFSASSLSSRCALGACGIAADEKEL
jgi:hypothetical protein